MYVRNHANGMLRHLDFNLVQTTLGAMIEPRTLYPSRAPSAPE